MAKGKKWVPKKKAEAPKEKAGTESAPRKKSPLYDNARSK